MNARVHTIETFGTVDGPGVRMVVFLQGCPLRCLYCHNPDSWDMTGGEEKSVEEILSLYRKNRAFYQKGGITVSGGEPMLQSVFVQELFSACRREGIHTCLDTSGIVFDGDKRWDELLAVTDLVLLDIKALDGALHRKMTGADNQNVLAFARRLSEQRVPTWIRHVVVPNLNDGEDDLRRLGEFMAELSNVQALEVLPYHTMGVPKYKALGLTYPLGDTPPLGKEAAARVREIILKARHERLFV